jgi:hypothetical protein
VIMAILWNCFTSALRDRPMSQYALTMICLKCLLNIRIASAVIWLLLTIALVVSLLSFLLGTLAMHGNQLRTPWPLHFIALALHSLTKPTLKLLNLAKPIMKQQLLSTWLTQIQTMNTWVLMRKGCTWTLVVNLHLYLHNLRAKVAAEKGMGKNMIIKSAPTNLICTYPNCHAIVHSLMTSTYPNCYPIWWILSMWCCMTVSRFWWFMCQSVRFGWSEPWTLLLLQCIKLIFHGITCCWNLCTLKHPSHFFHSFDVSCIQAHR